MTRIGIAGALAVLVSLGCGDDGQANKLTSDSATDGAQLDGAGGGAEVAGPVADAGDSDASTSTTYVPFIDGAFTRVFVPQNGRYLNDHTIARGADGRWHLYGIANTGGGTPSAERAFLHASTPDLFGTWTEHADALVASAPDNEGVIWAPHVVAISPSRWSMYYYAGPATPDPVPRFIRRADSNDLWTWTRLQLPPDQRPPGGRDPFLIDIDGTWFLYSVSVSAAANGQIVVTRSTNLDDPRSWSDAVPVIEDPRPSFSWGNLESPTVVQFAGEYYLFLTRTGVDSPTDYDLTLVFRSSDPARFSWSPIAELRSHAAEVVQDGAEYFITSAGWTNAIGEINRGLSIARLSWAAVPRSR